MARQAGRDCHYSHQGQTEEGHLKIERVRLHADCVLGSPTCRLAGTSATHHGSFIPSAASNSFACIMCQMYIQRVKNRRRCGLLPEAHIGPFVSMAGCPTALHPAMDQRTAGHLAPRVRYAGPHPPLTPTAHHPISCITHSKFRRGHQCHSLCGACDEVAHQSLALEDVNLESVEK